MTTKEQKQASEQFRIDGEFEDFCYEQDINPEDPEITTWLQGYIDIQKKVINREVD